MLTRKERLRHYFHGMGTSLELCPAVEPETADQAASRFYAHVDTFTEHCSPGEALSSPFFATSPEVFRDTDDQAKRLTCRRATADPKVPPAARERLNGYASSLGAFGLAGVTVHVYGFVCPARKVRRATRFAIRGTSNGGSISDRGRPADDVLKAGPPHE